MMIMWMWWARFAPLGTAEGQLGKDWDTVLVAEAERHLDRRLDSLLGQNGKIVVGRRQIIL